MLIPNSKFLLNNTKIKYGVKLVVSYISLINPFLFDHYTYSNYKKLCYESPNEKIYVKQSYIILTWFYYINFVLNSEQKIKLKNVKLVVTPKKIKKFTLTKAPIAHKTNSKEQISTIFFCYKFFYNINDSQYFKMYKYFNSLNEVLLSILTNKNTISLSETNLLFLKKTKINIIFLDKFFFNYYLFLKQ